MTSKDNAYRATGEKPHEAYDFIAYPGDKKTWAPKWGFVTTTKDPDASVKGDTGVFPRGESPMFRFGGSFGGWIYGAAAYGGDPDDNGNVGPAVNDYSSSAGVFGTGVFVTGVAGTSTNGVGVYGQTGKPEPPAYPVSAGVFGLADKGSAIFGFSRGGNGVMGVTANGLPAVYGAAFQGEGVSGYSEWSDGLDGYSRNHVGIRGVSRTDGPKIPDPVTIAGVIGTSGSLHGVIGTSNANVGVYGYSSGNVGVTGATDNPQSYAGVFKGNVYVLGTFNAITKNAVVPFPDGSQRLLHCMESPEHWFEDFGSAKLARGRAVVKLDANFVKVIKSDDYRVFVTPEGNCHGLYVRHKSANSFEVHELTGGKSSVAFSYRIVGRRKDIKGHQRFARIKDPIPPLPTRAARRTPRKPAPTAAGLRAFIARVEKQAGERAPKGAEKARARMRANRARS
jgi:hypothetical protein